MISPLNGIIPLTSTERSFPLIVVLTSIQVTSPKITSRSRLSFKIASACKFWDQSLFLLSQSSFFLRPANLYISHKV